MPHRTQLVQQIDSDSFLDYHGINHQKVYELLKEEYLKPEEDIKFNDN